MPILLRSPEIVPLGPDAVGAEVDGKEPMEVRQSFLSEQVQRERDARRITYSSGALSQLF